VHFKRTEGATPALFVTTFLKEAAGVRRINGTAGPRLRKRSRYTESVIKKQ
jgi:hypothetical protein